MNTDEVYEIISAGQPTHFTFEVLLLNHVRECRESECIACESY